MIQLTISDIIKVPKDGKFHLQNYYQKLQKKGPTKIKVSLWRFQKLKKLRSSSSKKHLAKKAIR